MQSGASDPIAMDQAGRNAVATPPDGELVRGAVAGRRSDFDELIRRHQRQAVAVSYRLLGNTQDALEVAQDAFLKAFRGISGLQNPDAFGGWLLRIVSNLSLNFRRGRKTRRSLPLDDLLSDDHSEHPAQTTDPLKLLGGRELGRKLSEALEKLPDKQRRALLMFTIDEMAQKDVAAALDLSVEAVKWHVFQGRKKLRELLADQLEQ